MQKKIKLKIRTSQERFQEVEVLIRKHHFCKRVNLKIEMNLGKITLFAPPQVGFRSAKSFIFKNKDWLEENLKRRVFFQEGIKTQRQFDYLIKSRYKILKREAYQLILAKVNYFNQFYQFSFQRIFVKNQKSCWGSCSLKRNLNFNVKIIFLPPTLQDYVVVHELCHLKEFNHSSRFWLLVAETIPNYQKLRKQLKYFQ